MAGGMPVTRSTRVAWGEAKSPPASKTAHKRGAFRRSLRAAAVGGRHRTGVRLLAPPAASLGLDENHRTSTPRAGVWWFSSRRVRCQGGGGGVPPYAARRRRRQRARIGEKHRAPSRDCLSPRLRRGRGGGASLSPPSSPPLRRRARPPPSRPALSGLWPRRAPRRGSAC